MADIPALRKKALALPMKPGVYLMRDAGGTIIYVGKAKLLRNRVTSYFRGAHNLKTEAMIAKIADFSVIIASSEFEALVLENSLIKHHEPKYNILLKDDKGYPFVRIDLRREYPRFEIAAKRENDGAMYFGPFGGRGLTKNAVETICKTFGLPTCARKFPRDIGKERPCLNYHMGVCDAYCLPGKTEEEYRAALARAVMVLEGKTKELTDGLRGQMEAFAAALRFEEAAKVRDAVSAITALETQQHVWTKGTSDTDAVGFYRGTAKSCFTVLHYIGGKLLGKDAELLPDTLEEDGGAVSQLVRQFYGGQGCAPKSVLLPLDTGDAEELARYLTELSGSAVRVAVPQRGLLRDYISAAAENAKEEVRRATTAEERVTKTARWLAEALGLPEPPRRIEAFDISNTGSSEIVASMTVFEHGKPLKRDYRKFRIKSVTIENDYASMREAVGRRFARFAAGDAKFSPLPDLLLIDGGAAHASAAREAMEENGGRVPVFGMVKDDRHRTRALVTPDGCEIGIDAFPAAFAFIGSIQEETHRFAIEFHRARRSKALRASALDGIPGVGAARKEKLLRQFGSVKAISAAGEDELSKVVPKDAAKAVYEHFHSESGE